MIIEYIVLIITLIAFILASYEDIRKREVYDYLNFSYLFLILIITIFDILISNNFEPLKGVGFGLLSGFILGVVLFYSGLWGGGDTKFLIGFSSSIYYLLKIIPAQNEISLIYENYIQNFALYINLFPIYFTKILIAINILTLIFLLSILIINKNKKEIKPKIELIFLILILTIGISNEVNTIFQIILGFLAFFLIFFSKEDIFLYSYILIKKPIKNLKIGDMVQETSKKVPIKITNKNLEKIKKLNQKEVKIRKIIPLSTIVSLNFIIIILNNLSFNPINIKIIAFLLKFLFLGFLIGGLIGILIIIYFTIKNFKKIKIRFSKSEKTFISIFFIFLILISFFLIIKFNFFNSLLLFILIPIIIFIKISKQIESLIFVTKKDISKIVLGDWIVEDIIIKNHKYFSKEDFKLGVDEEQLKEIINLSKKYKNFNKILVKDGIAFIPPLFISFIILLFI